MYNIRGIKNIQNIQKIWKMCKSPAKNIPKYTKKIKIGVEYYIKFIFFNLKFNII